MKELCIYPLCPLINLVPRKEQSRNILLQIPKDNILK
uniref:Uncharacterized protein n=1 Tax=Podoviridae sp. ct8Lf7 TaxID=2827723 RepID=A0A8S5S185_9CAUD|nr:MAG TPA: hypothetical protein [Podoviridae sp. ct8Lf7]